MRAYLAGAAVALLTGGCTASLVEWDPVRRGGVVEARLCDYCTEPYRTQSTSARETMAGQCDWKGYRVEYEGRSDGAKALLLSAGRTESASKLQSRRHYWIFACVEGEK
jgi:hypothetical protein